MRLLAAVIFLLGCSGGSDEDRLIQRDDSQFDALETPEKHGECQETPGCVDSCIHSCIATPTGPMTCPIKPVPLPERLEGALCSCASKRCKWL